MRFDGRSVIGVAAHNRAARGLGYVPEERAVFADMTVEENIRIGALVQRHIKQADCLDAAYTLFPILRERRQQMAGTLSGGQQKMLGLARALALQPKLLMVDEPSEGLMPGQRRADHGRTAPRHPGRASRSWSSIRASTCCAQLCSRLYAMDRGVLIGMYRPSDFAGPDELAETILGEGSAA